MNLDRVAVGAYVSVSVRADVSADAGVDALVAVVHAHMPGDIYVHWGLGSEADDGAISADAWECPPAELMPPRSRRVSNWASGAAVQSPIDPHAGTVEIPLPSRPGHGLAFVLYDAEKQCYYDHQGAAFFLDSRLSADTAARATATSGGGGADQQSRVRAIAEAEAANGARQHAEMSRARRGGARAPERDALAGGGVQGCRGGDGAAERRGRAAAAERRRAAAEKEAEYQRQTQAAAEADAAASQQGALRQSGSLSPVGSAYERFINDPANPFRDFSPRAAAARGEDALPGLAGAAATAAPPAPPPGFVNPGAVDPALAAGAAAFAPSLSPGGGGGGRRRRVGRRVFQRGDRSLVHASPAPAPPPPAARLRPRRLSAALPARSWRRTPSRSPREPAPPLARARCP